MKKWLLVTLSFLLKMSDCWHQEKKIPQTICAKSRLSQSSVEFRQPTDKLPRCSPVFKEFRVETFCSQRHLSVWWALVSLQGVWWSNRVICCRNTGSEHHLTTAGQFFSQGIYHREGPTALIWVHPFLALLQMSSQVQSRIAEIQQEEARNEGMFLHVLHPLETFSSIQITHTHNTDFKPYWKDGLKRWKWI